MEKFNTINDNIETEIIEKKSRFIANIFYVENAIEAENKIKEIKKKYYDAKHNCYAYRVIEDNKIIERFSDDGEPSSTAGAPILSVITKRNLANILIVITRYFGGILLGTGGLVRAYSKAATDVINKSNIIIKVSGYEIEITLNYSDLEIFKHICRKNNIKIIDEKYDENIKLKIEISKIMYENIKEKFSNKKTKIQKMEIIRNIYVEKTIDL